ncbi:MAG: NfeD family protein [Caulobacteraceae bacterium]|nr:MAG: NfeD family protein [Caulobacteraceae bacterium]
MGGLVDFYGTHTFWVWIAVAAAILAFEVAAGSGWLLWPSASAAVMAFVSLFTSSAALEIGLFAALTIVTTLTARKFWPREPQGASDINDNVARLVGHRGRVAMAFVGGAGRVMVDGKEWAADSEDGAPLEIESIVEVVGLRAGTRLLVRPVR